MRGAWVRKRNLYALNGTAEARALIQTSCGTMKKVLLSKNALLSSQNGSLDFLYWIFATRAKNPLVEASCREMAFCY
jgi:hypothetical protein